MKKSDFNIIDINNPAWSVILWGIPPDNVKNIRKDYIRSSIMIEAYVCVPIAETVSTMCRFIEDAT